MKKDKLIVYLAVTMLGGAWLLFNTGIGKAEPFTLKSSAFKDGEMMPKVYAAENEPDRICGGKNISPPFAWSNAPKGTKSFAILMWDQEGHAGEGVSHWIAYDLPADMTSIAEGEASQPSKKFVSGAANRDTRKYRGPCVTKDELPHHYEITVMALDIAPGTLKPGLTREAFFETIKGRSLAGVSIIGIMGRNKD